VSAIFGGDLAKIVSPSNQVYLTNRTARSEREVMADEDHMRALHWLPESDRWEDIPWDQWLKFREWVGAGEPLPGIRAGIHYFVVCIHDDGVAVNVIPQKYMIDPDGKIGRDNFAGLTRQEREDYQRLVVKREYDPGDQECIDAIHAKMGAANDPQANRWRH
jgi:hypothetical protein